MQDRIFINWPPGADPVDIYQRELEILQGFETDRKNLLERYEFEMADAEKSIAYTKRVPIYRVTQNPTPEIREALERYREATKESFERRFREIDEQEERQKERVKRAGDVIR